MESRTGVEKGLGYFQLSWTCRGKRRHCGFVEGKRPETVVSI